MPRHQYDFLLLIAMHITQRNIQVYTISNLLPQKNPVNITACQYNSNYP